VVAEFGADPERVAISGWSYGGFMAGYALTHSERFALGFAGAGVHDWQLYDTIYTERYMSTPQQNPEGYRQTSVIRAADRLSGHLVLMHGTIDDNVHLQNTMLLVDALQKAGEDSFELMLYPGARHGVRSSHRPRMMWRVLRDRFGLSDPDA
jgi:dipeptidyl aminopeptidase/acylaminoacyl peptidase